MHIVWRKRTHDGVYYPAVVTDYRTPDNGAARERASQRGERAIEVDHRDRYQPLRLLARLYPVEKG